MVMIFIFFKFSKLTYNTHEWRSFCTKIIKQIVSNLPPDLEPNGWDFKGFQEGTCYFVFGKFTYLQIDS